MNLKNSLAVLLLAFIMPFVTSCRGVFSGPDSNRSAGDIAEILVVTQNEQQWKGMIGDSIRAYFNQDQYGLPQPEPMNNLAHVNIENFRDLLRRHKCILIVMIDPNLKNAVVETGVDSWANPQRVVKIIAPDRISWCETFNNNKDALKLMYDEVEHRKIMTILRPSAKTIKIQNHIKKKLGFDITIPADFTIAREEPNFLWLQKNYEKFTYGIFIYDRPYKDTIQFEKENLVSVRDTWLERCVPGPTSGSYMTTEKDYVPPMLTYISDFPMGNGFAAELRGMWRLEGDYMAGPFVSYTFHDEKKGSLVTLEGFVYYPNHDKRDDLLRLESILYSVKPGE